MINIYLPMYCAPRKPVRLLSVAEKKIRYAMAYEHLSLVLDREYDFIARMATISCILNGMLESYSWVGFYRVLDGELIIGPYQGTMGCLHISRGRGVCGTAWEKRESIIVPDVHKYDNYISCDSLTRSEIVIPVFGPTGDVVAVLDVDSDELGAFDELDQEFLEQIVNIL